MSNSARKRKQQKEQQKSAFGGLRKVELIGIGIIVLAGLMYMLSKCGRDELPPPQDNPEEVIADSTTENNNTVPPSVEVEENKRDMFRRKLYVVIDSLKFRTGPRLDSTLIRPLPFGEELMDMGEVSDFEQTLRISADELTTEPWIKVKDKFGKVGWVYGAGIRPYKKQGATFNNEETE
jgi:hypothetical protein